MQRGRKGKWLTATTVVAVASIGLVGCSSGGSSSGAASKTLTIQVQTGAVPEVDAFIKVFKKSNPGVTVKTTSVSQTAKTGSNLQVLTSSNAPDVAVVPTNTQVYSKLTAGHQLVSLSDVWKKADLQKRYGSSLANSLKTSGTPYVVSYDSTIYNVVYYNTALFSKLGIPDPKDHRISSTAELNSIVSKLKANGKQGLAIGPGDGYQASWLIDALLPTVASPSELQNYLTSWQGGDTKVTSKYTSGPFISTLKQIQAMGKDGVFQTGYLGQKVAQAESLFVQGDAGMLLDGEFSVAVLKKDGISFDYDWALLPPINSSKKSQLSLYNGDAYAIPTHAANPTLAKKFLESMMSVEGQTTTIATGDLPAVNDVPKSAFSALAPQITSQLADEAANGGQPGWTSVVPGGLGQQLVDPQVQEMLNGTTTPAAIGTSVQNELATVRASAK